MTTEILERVYPQTSSHLLRALAQIIHDDLGADQQREFIAILGTIESVLKDTTAKLSSGNEEVKLLNDLDAFQRQTHAYYRELFRRIAGKTHANN